MDNNIKNRFKEGDSNKSDNISPITIFFVIGFLVLLLTIQGINEDTKVDISELKTDIETLTLQQNVLAIQSDNSTATPSSLKNQISQLEEGLNAVIANQQIISNQLQILENQNKKVDKRISDLESYLIGRLKKLEKSTTTTNSKKTYNNVSSSEKYKYKSNWRQINLGMSQSQVRSILGEPERVAGGAFIKWTYKSGWVEFYRSSGVSDWKEPSW